MLRITQLLVTLCLLLAGLPTLVWAQAGEAVVLSIDGAVGPATDDYLERALADAARDGAALVVLRMDTPGGLDSSMRGIIKHISASPVPVVSYVSPSGARAASAGTYILYASHIAAMAPGTNLGAATPIPIGGGSAPAGAEHEDTSARKVVNDAVAYIRGLAQLRGRNADWAEQAVREAASLPASEALKLGVIDVIAANLDELFGQIDGREVNVAGGTRVLHSVGLRVIHQDPDWRSRFLAVITDPNMAYILMLLGIYGLILEFSHPGTVLPGTVGAISLLLAMYAFQVLPINYAGVGLILLGVGLMVAEAFQPSFGALGLGGMAAFMFGSIILMDTKAPGFGIDIGVIVAFALISALVFIVVVGMALRARRRPVVSGREELLGGTGVALEDFTTQGVITIHSEQWRAVTNRAVRKGDAVKVIGIKGLTLQVQPLDAAEGEE